MFFLRFFEISGNSEQKNISQTIKQVTQFSYLLLIKEIFLVYSFSELAAAKGNYPETTW